MVHFDRPAPDLGLRQRPQHRLPLAAVLDPPRRAADDPARRGAGPARAGRRAHRHRFAGFSGSGPGVRGAGPGPPPGPARPCRRRARRRGRTLLGRPRPAASGRAAAALGRHHDVARGDGGLAVPDRPDGGDRGCQRGAEVRRLPDLTAGRAAGPGAVNWVAEVKLPASRPGRRLGQDGTGRGRAAVVRGLEVRLAGRARADHRGVADPGVPDVGPRPLPPGVPGPSPYSATRPTRCTRSGPTAAPRRW